MVGKCLEARSSVEGRTQLTHLTQDAVMEAGGFMSFVLLFSWTVSGLALLTG
jgi:hypothetical protein